MFFTAPVAFRRPAAATRRPDQGFERFLLSTFQAPQRSCTPVEQDDKSWTLRLDLPGITREHLSITIDGKLARLQTVEGAPRAYKLAYELPQDIDAASSRAKLENGVLTLTLAKLLPVDTRVKIAIE